MSARSSSRRYTAASSAGARPTRRFSASTGTKPASSCSRRAAEYLAAHPPHEARSVSFTRPVSVSTAALPRVERRNVGVCEPFVYRLRSVHRCYDRMTASIPACREDWPRENHCGSPVAFRGEEEPFGSPAPQFCTVGVAPSELKRWLCGQGGARHRWLFWYRLRSRQHAA